MTNLGLRKSEIKSIIESNLNRNPDLFYYIEDSNIKELITLLSNGIAEAIEKNTEEVIYNLSKKNYF